MKNTVKKLIQSVIISVVTLFAGCIITCVSFNLFDNLTSNQMKVLFAFDVICLAATGAFTLFIYDRKKLLKKRKKKLERLHYQRILKREQEFSQIEQIIDHSDFAASA